MTERTQTSARIFWPKHLSRARSGFLVGFNHAAFIASVSTIVSGVRLEALVAALGAIPSPSSDPLVVLGQWDARPLSSRQRKRNSRKPAAESVPRDKNGSLQLATPSQRRNYDLWLDMERGRGGVPRLVGVQCIGFRYHPATLIVLYEQPSLPDYFAATPLDLRGAPSFSWGGVRGWC